jgi:hypothetical protein
VLKGLVTAACVVTIAAGGVYLWSAWSDHRMRAAVATKAAEQAAADRECDSDLRVYVEAVRARKDTEALKTRVIDCAFYGYLSNAEVILARDRALRGL